MSVNAAEAIERSSFTNVDKRLTAPRLAVRPEQQAAHDALKQRVSDAAADFDPMLGSPKWVHARGGFLTEANGEGRSVSRESAKRFEKDPDQVVKGFLHEHRQLFRHGPEVLDAATKRRDHTNQLGIRTVAWEQQVDGIPVFDSVFVASTTARGELISVSSLFVPEPEAAADRGTVQRAAKVRAPSLNAERALRAAAADLGETISEMAALDDKPAARTLKQTFKLKPLPGDASVKLVWLPLDGDTLRLCWEVELTRRESSERFRLLVDAETGEVLVRRKLTVEVSEVLYRVYTSDSPSPLSPGYAVPTNLQPPFVARQLLAISNLNATASPLGWLNDGVYETRGNNVDAHLDRDGDDLPDLPRPHATTNASGQRVFDFPLDLSQSPSTYTLAATVQLFYWCNFMHDKLYELGFTESAGNFQKDNFGKGGADNDAILADAQDGSGVNNANFTPSRDGTPGRIQMFLFPGPNPARDGDLDAEVVCHEYTHGLTDRLVGGGVGLDSFGHLQSGGMGEGWSDFYALSLLSEFGDDPGANYAMSGYVTYQFAGLQQNYYYGIRRYPYTTNLNADPLTFKDIDLSTTSTHPGVPRNPIITSSGSEVHRQGEIWCSMLWDMRAFLFRKYAPTNTAQFNDVNKRVLGYVTGGLQLSPANPNFAQARDAILLAIRVTPGSESDTNEAWAAFSRRGLGVGAVCPDSTTTLGAIESYDAPRGPEFDVLPNQAFSVAGTVGGPFAPVSFPITLLNASTTNIVWGASVNAQWLRLSMSNGLLVTNVPITNLLSITTNANVLPVGTYQATVFFTNVTRAQVVSRAVILSVLPVQGDPLIVTPANTFLIQGPRGGPFTPSTRSYQLANVSTNAVSWRAFTTNNWLSVSPTNGTLANNTAITNITVALNANANALTSGTYQTAFTVINSTSGVRTDLPVSLRVSTSENFMEDFSTHAFDLSYSTLTLTPNLSENFYRACHESASTFPVDPTGGTPLALHDDEYQQVFVANGRQVSLYGFSSNAVYVGANGNISFDPGTQTNAFFPSVGEFFSHTRIAPFYADLNPEASGTVSYLQLEDRFVVTWQDVPEFGTVNLNSVQVELFFSGAIRMTWLKTQITNPQNLTVYAGLSRGAGLPADFAQSDLSAFGPCLPDAQLLLPVSAVEGDGSLQGVLLFSTPLTNDLHVTLTSSDTNEVVVPATIVVAAGQTFASFPMSSIYDYIPDGTQSAIITANFPDRPSVSATILIDDSDTANLSLQVPFTGTEGGVLFGGGLVTADVTAIHPITVHLISENPARVQVPAFVVIPPGQSFANFDLNLVDNTLLDGSENVVIEAFVVNWSGDGDVIRVNDNESRALTLALPPEAAEGQGTLTNAGTITFGGKPLTNIVIALQSDHSSLISVPAFVTNQAGQTSVKFNLVVGDDNVTNTFDAVQITASAAGFISATGAVVLIDNERPFPPTNPTPTNFATHVPRDTTLTWAVNSHASGATLYDVYLGTNAVLSAGDLIATTSIPIVAPPRQLDPDTTYYWQVRTRLAPFPEAAGPIWQFRTASFGFQIASIASPQFLGVPFPLSVTARDEFGLTVTNYTGNLTVSNSAPVPSAATIVITELEPGSFNRIEFENVSSRQMNIGGWKIALYDWQSWPAPRTVFTVPAPSISKPGEVFLLRNFPSQFFPGTYPLFGTSLATAWNNNVANNQIAVMLLDGVGNVVDFVCAAGADPTIITQPASVPPAQWNSPPVVALTDSSLNYQRIGRRDMNSSSDWVFAPRSTGTNNVGLFSSFSDNAAIAFTAALGNFVAGTATGTVTMLDQAHGATLGVSDPQGRSALSNPFDVLSHNDIALSVLAPGDVLVNEPVTYQFSITNTGPADATGVTLTDLLSTNSNFTSATPSQGACSFSNGVVTCELGTVSGSSTASVTVVAMALSHAMLTNFAVITRAEPDAYPANNSVLTVTSTMFPQISVFDMTNVEPSSATATMTFNVRMSVSSTLTSSVAYATSSGTAAAGVDYQPTNGVLTFPPGVTNRTISVTLFGDTLSESNETFFVNLFSATNADISRGLATGTINDNDGNPALSINDVAIIEGDSGAANVTFTVTLSAPSGKIAIIGYITGNGTALAGLDYEETYGTLFFAPGVTNLTVSVPVFGDRLPESTKTFFLNLVNPGNALVARSQGKATIFDNDLAPIDRFTFDPIPPANLSGQSTPFTISARDGNGNVATNFNDPVTLLALQEERIVTIASNSTPWSLPLGTSFHDTRLQSIYFANEIGGAGRIVGLALDVTTVPGQVLSNWTIRLQPTVDSTFTFPTWNVLGWVTNYQNDLLLSSTGWVTFSFSTPFDYDGRTHLMVDFSFNNSSFSADGIVRSTGTTPLNRSIYLRTDSAYGNPLDWVTFVTTPPPTAIARVPNVRFIIDRNLPLTPLTSGHFVNGVWSGEVLGTRSPNGLVPTQMTNVVLRVVDENGHLGESNPFALSIFTARIKRQGNAVDIQFPTLTGRQFVVETGAAPTGPWTSVSGILTGDGSVAHFSHVPPGTPQFYRVRLVP